MPGSGGGGALADLYDLQLFEADVVAAALVYEDEAS